MKLIKLLIFFICTAFTAHAQTDKLAFDSTFKTTHDSTIKVASVQNIIVSHDTTAYAVFSSIMQTTHDSTFLKQGWFRIRVKTKSFTHDTIVRTLVPVKSTTTHDSSVGSFANKNITVTHDTVATFYKAVTRTIFGAKIQDGTSTDQIAVLHQLGTNYARPTSVDITAFNGVSKRIDDFYAAGIRCIVNINNINSTRTVAFPKDLKTYEARLRYFLDYYADKIEVAVIENEPTNKNYYSGPMSDYLAELAVAVRVCHEYNVKVADGCTHIEYIMQIINGNPRPPANVADVKELIAGYANLDLDYVNVHTQGQGNAYPAGQIKGACDYLRISTGHPVMSNEWHLENATDNLVKDMVQQWRDAGVIYSIIWGGGGQSPADAINIGTTLTLTGVTYSNSIR